MNEEHVVEHLLEYVNGNLDDETKRRVHEHLDACGSCKRDFESLNSLWSHLSLLLEEGPSQELRLRFNEMLADYERDEPRTTMTASKSAEHFWQKFWSRRPAIQVGFAAACLIAGVLAGYNIKQANNGKSEVAELRDEVRGLSRLLTVSLLQQQSASERLKGVSWSSRLDESDPEIIAALLNTLKFDSNVNVRLAALDEVAREVHRADVRRELIMMFPKQQSPLVQIALVDVLVQINEKESREALRNAMHTPNLNQQVKNRIESGIQQLL